MPTSASIEGELPVLLPHLFAPGRINSMALRNRILMCPMGDNQATAGGYVTEQQIAYFEARARGGAALLLVGSVGITAPEGLASPQQSAIGGDDFLAGWSQMAARVHAHGAKLALQLVHNGKNAVEDIIAGRPLMVPSIPGKEASVDPLMSMLTPEEAGRMGTAAQVAAAPMTFHEMTREDIEAMAAAYAEATLRAREAGVDGVELHAGHGYLIDNFLSPTTNHRVDEYGGSVENRARFLIEILEAIRRRVGTDYPVWCRINGEELFTQGETLSDACRIARWAEAAGSDAFHVSAYADPGRGIGYSEAHATHVPGRFLSLAAEVKRHVSVPVIAVGRIEPEVAEDVLARGEADFIAMGRKLLADPDLPNKLQAGRAERVRPCVYHYRCISQIFVRDSVRCVVNAQTGLESAGEIGQARVSRRVLIVGGGPAGLEAARLAAQAGHEVVLAEASERLGGRFRLAARCSPENAALLDWLIAEIERSKVEVRSKTRLSAEEIAGQGFDEVILATGAHWPRPDAARTAGPGLRTLDSLGPWLEGDESEDGRSVVVLGGDRIGLSLAEVARARGASVVVLESSAVFCASSGLVGRWRAVHDAREHGIELRPEATLSCVDPEAVHWREAEGAHSVRADHVFVASGAHPDSSLLETLRERGLSVHAVGDCQAVRFVEGAMLTAREVVAAL